MIGKLREQIVRATATSIRKPVAALTNECATSKKISSSATLWRMQHAQGCFEELFRRTVAIQKPADKLSRGN
jgi:hypothetical protein